MKPTIRLWARLRGRWWWWSALLCSAVLVLLSLAIDGWVFPVRIAGGSMANTLLGDHYRIACQECRFPFRCDAQPPPESQRAVCPNCGCGQNRLAQAPIGRGDRVLIDRLSYLLRSPRRGELLAFRDPADPTRLAVKRVVGLPGEHVAIRGGDLYIDGRIQQKSFAAFRARAVLVHDDTHRAQRAEGARSRWQPAARPSRWQLRSGGFRGISHGAAPGPVGTAATRWDWLQYRHHSAYSGPSGGAEAPIRDNYGYNQAVSRVLNEVRDLLLACQLHLRDPRARVALRAHDGRDAFQVEFSRSDRRVVLRRNGVPQVDVPMDELPDRPLQLRYGVWDRQVELRIDGISVLSWKYSDRFVPFQPTSRPLAIAVAGGPAELGELRVYRDLYYLPPDPGTTHWSRPGRLDSDTFFVLGDNPPISLDSRQGLAPALSRRQLVGRVVGLTVRR